MFDCHYLLQPLLFTFDLIANFYRTTVLLAQLKNLLLNDGMMSLFLNSNVFASN